MKTKSSHLIHRLLLYLCTPLALFISVTGFLAIDSLSLLIFQIVFLPVTLSLTAAFLTHLLTRSAVPTSPRLLIYYNFTVTSAMVILGFTSAASLPQLISAVIFSPLAIYFFLLALPRRTHAIRLPKIQVMPASQLPVEEGRPVGFDLDRRMFLKLIGSAGLSVFFFTLFTRRAEAAFFGSVPGPGTVALKDTSGTKIDPAEKYPTDGYNITQLDDSATPAYYGFVNKLGQWFIMKEDSTATPNYSYAKGSSGFATNWTSRATLTYDYFDNVF